MGAKTKQVAHESEMYAYYCLPQSENETMDGNGTKSRPQSQHQRRQQSSWKARQNQEGSSQAEQKVTPNADSAI
jgi:hypothetical protein